MARFNLIKLFSRTTRPQPILSEQIIYIMLYIQLSDIMHVSTVIVILLHAAALNGHYKLFNVNILF